MKTIFYNELEGNIRAGWRMGIFVAVLAAVTKLFTFPGKFIEAHSSVIPSFAMGEIVFYGALVVATYLVALFLEKRPPFPSVGFSVHGNVIRELIQGTLMGGGMMTIIFVTEYFLGMVTFSFKPLTLVEFVRLFGASTIIFVIGAFGEELLFRGYLFQTMVEGSGKIIAVVTFAAFFGVAHASNPNVTTFSIINVTLAGAWLSIAYFKTRGLWFPIALHFSWNFMQNHVFAFPVSGIQFQKFQLGVLVQSGPSWFTGGTFGPEGGALTTLMVVASACLIHFSDWIRPSEQAWTLEQWKADGAAKKLAEEQKTDQNAALS